MPVAYWFLGFWALLGLIALVGGLVMWCHSRRAGWAPVLMLFGVGPIWGLGVGLAFARTLNAHLNERLCSAAGCAPQRWPTWHVIHVWDAVIMLPRLVGLAYALVLLWKEWRHGVVA